MHLYIQSCSHAQCSVILITPQQCSFSTPQPSPRHAQTSSHTQCCKVRHGNTHAPQANAAMHPVPSLHGNNSAGSESDETNTMGHTHTSHLSTGGPRLGPRITPHDVSLDAPLHCKNFMSCSYAQCSEILMTPQQHSISTHLNLHHGMLRPHKPNAAECNMGHPQPCSHAPSTIPTWQHRGMVPHAHIHHAI